MKKILKKISILLAVLAFAMLFKCSEAVIVGDESTKITAGLYTNLVNGEEIILVSPNASYQAKDGVLSQEDLDSFCSKNSITIKSIEKKLERNNGALGTGDVIEDTQGKKRTLVLCGDADGNGSICGSGDANIVVIDYIKKVTDTINYNDITDFQKVAANLYNGDGKLNVFDINRMHKKNLNLNINEGNQNNLQNTLIYTMPTESSEGDNPDSGKIRNKSQNRRGKRKNSDR